MIDQKQTTKLSVKDYYSRVSINVTGFQDGDVAKVSCQSGFLPNSELSSVLLYCENSTGLWTGDWGFHYFQEEVENFVLIPIILMNYKFSNRSKDSSEPVHHTFSEDSIGPYCIEAETPVFESLATCENGCQVGNCREGNRSQFRCECAEGIGSFSVLT